VNIASGLKELAGRTPWYPDSDLERSGEANFDVDDETNITPSHMARKDIAFTGPTSKFGLP
jgi:hypothetical protein